MERLRDIHTSAGAVRRETVRRYAVQRKHIDDEGKVYYRTIRFDDDTPAEYHSEYLANYVAEREPVMCRVVEIERVSR